MAEENEGDGDIRDGGTNSRIARVHACVYSWKSCGNEACEY